MLKSPECPRRNRPIDCKVGTEAVPIHAIRHSGQRIACPRVYTIPLNTRRRQNCLHESVAFVMPVS